MPSQEPPQTPHSLLLTHLSTKTTTLEDLHQTLLSSLQRAGWTERVRALAIELLRAGRAETFEEAFEEVVGLVVSGNGNGSTSNAIANGSANGNAATSANGAVEDEDRDAEGEEEEGHGTAPGTEDGYVNGNGNVGLNGVGSGRIEDIDVRIPEAVVGEGMRFLQEALDGVLDTEGEEDEEVEEGDEKPPPPAEKSSNGTGKRGRENGDAEKVGTTKKAKGVGTKTGKGGK
jgi:hypothetical protein